MSTRAIIHIYEEHEDETPLISIYKHYDGYPTKHGVGETLKEYAMDAAIMSGLPLRPTRDMHNGMGCFAAGLIKHLKNGPGDVYIIKPGTDHQHESYVYTVRPSESFKDKLTVEVENTCNSKRETILAG